VERFADPRQPVLKLDHHPIRASWLKSSAPKEKPRTDGRLAGGTMSACSNLGLAQCVARSATKRTKFSGRSGD
jgi:hypothetical protein